MTLTGLGAIREKTSFSALAAELKITRDAISQWKNKIPAERVLEIERITGIHRSRLRPDLFQDDIPRPPASEAQGEISQAEKEKGKSDE